MGMMLWAMLLPYGWNEINYLILFDIAGALAYLVDFFMPPYPSVFLRGEFLPHYALV